MIVGLCICLFGFVFRDLKRWATNRPMSGVEVALLSTAVTLMHTSLSGRPKPANEMTTRYEFISCP